MKDSDSSCDIELSCPVRTNWQRITDAVRDALEAIPLTDGAQGEAVFTTLIGGGLGWTRLTLGDVDWCAEVPARQKGTPSSTDKFDRVDKFLGEKNFHAPAGCPVPPLGA